jgi:hypothetical protein
MAQHYVDVGDADPQGMSGHPRPSTNESDVTVESGATWKESCNSRPKPCTLADKTSAEAMM